MEHPFRHLPLLIALGIGSATLKGSYECFPFCLTWHSGEACKCTVPIEVNRCFNYHHQLVAVGILEMEIYILGTRLVMIVETAPDFQWDEAMARLATLPRQEEWEAHVAQFQQCAAGATSDQKWQMMERMFHLYD